jgi:hypothetical protein
MLSTLLTPENGVRGSGMRNIPRTAAEKRAEEVRGRCDGCSAVRRS